MNAVPLNTVYGLLRSLRADLTEAVKDVNLFHPAKNNKPAFMGPPGIYLFRDPPPDKDGWSHMPFISLAPVSGFHQNGMWHCTVGIRIGVHAPNEPTDEDAKEFEIDADAEVAAMMLLNIVHARVLSSFSAPLEGLFRFNYQAGNSILPWNRPFEQAPEHCELISTVEFTFPGFH